MSVPTSDSIEALAALYTAERTDVQNVLGHSLAIISILVAYSAVLGATWSTKPDAIPVWLTVFLPVPVLAAIAWHSQMNSLVFVHNRSIKVLEGKLLLQVPSIPSETKKWIGATCGRLVTDLPILLKERRIGLAAASIIAYGGIGAIILALTTASVIIPIGVKHEWEWLAGSIGIVYLLVIGLILLSYVETFKINNRLLTKWAASANNNGLL